MKWAIGIIVFIWLLCGAIGAFIGAALVRAGTRQRV